MYSNAPIQNAAEHDSELLERLIRANVDVNTKPAKSLGATALQRAAAAGNFQSLKILLKVGANVNDLPGKHEGRTAIEGAAEHGRLDMVRYLLEAGADIKGRTNKNYRRTVYRAWKVGHRTVVRTIQDWKRENYEQEDCEDVEVILESTTYDELVYESAVGRGVSRTGRYCLPQVPLHACSHALPLWTSACSLQYIGLSLP
jgi:ankyrin repeat protein